MNANFKFIGLVCFSSMTMNVVAENRIYKIDTNKTYQTIDNFSASDAWRCDFIGKYWPEEKKQYIADLLFSREFDENGNPKGMALSNWRINIGAGSFENRENKEVTSTWNRTECFLSPDGTWDFSKQAGQQWFMRSARERGMNNFLLFANSAPYFYTRSASTLSSDMESINIQDDKFDDFALFLVLSAKHFQNEGFDIKYISPINEPNVNWSTNSWQEGSFATKEDIFKMVKELDKAITKEGIAAKIIIPEVGDLKYLFDSDSVAKMPDDIIRSFFYKTGKYNVLGFPNLYNCIAAHDYWTAYPPQKLVDLRSKVRKEIEGNGYDTKFWASEYCILEKNDEITMPSSPLKSINLGLYVARLIHTNLTVANASAWQWWTAVSLGEDVPIQLLPLKNSLPETVKYDGIVSPTKMLWACANFSFFVRPGMKRIDIKPVNRLITDLEAATSLMTSAYTDGSQIVNVFINYSEQDEYVNLECDGHKKGKMYVTSMNKNLQYIGEHKLKSLFIPARSVVTIVID